jgi:hypothetical protein
MEDAPVEVVTAAFISEQAPKRRTVSCDKCGLHRPTIADTTAVARVTAQSGP